MLLLFLILDSGKLMPGSSHIGHVLGKDWLFSQVTYFQSENSKQSPTTISNFDMCRICDEPAINQLFSLEYLHPLEFLFGYFLYFLYLFYLYRWYLLTEQLTEKLLFSYSSRIYNLITLIMFYKHHCKWGISLPVFKIP